MNRITRIAAAVLGVGMPFAAMTPALADERGVHRAELHDFERDHYDPMIDRVCFFDRQQRLREAQALDPTAYATECAVERSPERSYSWYFIVWPDAETPAAR